MARVELGAGLPVLRTSASGRIGQAADPCRAHRRLSIAHAPLVVIEEIGC